MSNRFVLWGGFGGHNLGDEAILWAMSGLLRSLEPERQQSVLIRGHLSPSAAQQYAAWGIEPVRLGSPRSLRLLRSGRLIVGGGQLLDDSGLGWPVGWTSLVLLVNAFAPQPALILCIGAEPIVRRTVRSVARNFYSLAAVITCRDAKTADVMADLGVPSEKIVRTKDVVFSLAGSRLLPTRTRSGDSPRIVIVVSHDPQRTPGRPTVFLELARSLAAAGCTVALVAHDLRLEYDYGAIVELERELENEHRIATVKAGEVEEVLQIYADADAVISGRMHPLILSSLVKSLPIAVRGTRKVSSLIESLALPSLSLEESPERNKEVILSCLSERETRLLNIAEKLVVFRSSVETITAQALTRRP